MTVIPPPEELDDRANVPLDVVLNLLREWRNHWRAVEQVQADLPDRVRQQVLTRPADADEALAELRPRHAVLVHPDAASGFVSYLDAAIRAVSGLAGQATSPRDRVTHISGAAERPTGAGGPDHELRRRIALLESQIEALYDELRKAR